MTEDISIWETMTRRHLWAILVPTQFNDGKPIRTRYHRVWDAKVREISGGLTILHPAKGQWVCPEGKLYSERMIPVQILANESEIDRIILMTGHYYKQKAVLCYEISRNVKLIHFDENGNPK